MGTIGKCAESGEGGMMALLMRFRITALLIFLCLSTPVLVWAQHITALGMEQGLSNSTVTCIYKDHFGFMWMGTFDGLNRYDGYSFTRFRKKPGDSNSLPDNNINAIEESANGNLYIGTKKGLALYDANSNSFSYLKYLGRNPKSNIPNLIDVSVNSIKRGGQNTLYIGTSGLGLLYLQKNDLVARQIPVKKLLNYSVTSIAADKSGNIWFVSPDLGLCYYATNARKTEVVAAGLKGGNCITFDAADNLWIGTNSGLYKTAKPYKQILLYDLPGANLSGSRIMGLTTEDDSLLWVSTDGDGLPLINTRSNKLLKRWEHGEGESISSNSMYTVFVDNQSRKWVGTMRGGVNVIDASRDIFKTISHEPYSNNTLVHNTVFSFCEDGNDVWIGTDGGGVSVWNRRENRFRNIVFPNRDKKHYGVNQLPSIIKDNKENIWLASYGSGVKRYNKATGVFEDIRFRQSDKGAKYVFRLYQDKQGHIWAGCIRGRYAGNLQKGLWLYNEASQVFEEAPYPITEEVLSMEEDHAGNLWVGTLKNLIRINHATGILKVFRIESYVRALHCDKTGRLWAGTVGGGLLLFDQKQEEFRTFSEDSGLPNSTVVSIEEDNAGNLWLGTFNGLSRMNIHTFKFTNFYAADGLPSNQFYYNASLKLSTGELLFGGIKGFSWFAPANIRVNTHFPALRITGLSVLNKPLGGNSEFSSNNNSIHEIKRIVLPYDKSMFSVEFAALEYSFPQKIQYAYYLRGWDKTWNDTSSLRTVSYSRLNEGRYTLEIKSTNASGIWNTKPLTIAIQVLPPWYRTWWAYLLYCSLAGLAVYAYIYYQKEKARLQFEVKLSSLKAQQEEELNEKKISFFTNIAHELRTPLTLIVNPIEDLLTNDGRNINLVDIGSVHRNTRRLLSLVDQLLLFKSTENEISDLKPEVLDIAEVCNEVFLCFKDQVKRRGLSYSFENNIKDPLIFADKEKVEIVLFNLLSNAIKYSNEKGEVVLVLNEKGERVELKVKNTGPLIPSSVGETLFNKFYRLEQASLISRKSGFGIGLFISKKIADKQGGDLTYASTEADGTIFTYEFPKNEKLIPVSYDKVNAANKTASLSEIFNELPVRDEDPEKGTISENMRNVIEGVVENKPNVLVVDDDDDLRAYISQLLKPDYNIFEAASGEDALQLLKKADPDIIVSDVVMGAMSGVDFCLAVKESKSYSHVPVILLTATSSADIKLKGVECGAEDYITKPFEKDFLLARIKSILKGRDSLKRYFFNEVTLQNNTERVSEEYSTFLKRCMDIVEKHLDDDQFNVKELAKEIGMSQSNLYRKVKAISDLSTNEFIRYIRMRKAAELMIQTDIQVKEVAYKVGFQDVRYFREQFSKVFGHNPSEYIKRYRRTFLRAPGT